MTRPTDIAALSEHLLAQTGRHITAIAGPPGAGKSTVAEQLVDRLNQRDPGCAAVFPMDGYHFDDILLEARGQRARKGAPFTFDVDGYRHMLMRLREHPEEAIAVPVFDREIEIARAGARIIEPTVRHIVTEGNYLLLKQEPWSRLVPAFDTTLFLSVPREVLLARLEARWAHWPEARKRRQIDDNDMVNVDLVRANSRPADFVIASERN